MPTFFFDLDDGSEVHRDPEGVELKDVLDARLHAASYLAEAARELIPDGGRDRKVEVTVRDAGHGDLLTASVYFAVQVLDRSKMN